MNGAMRSRACMGAILAILTVCGRAASLPARPDTVPPETGTQPALDPGFVSGGATVGSHAPDVVTRQILQDARGDLWFATFSGVVRYDGKTFTNVTREASLPPTRAFSLLRDRHDRIWIGTARAGVLRSDGVGYTQITARDGLASDSVLSMMEDRDGNLWFGHEGGGATRYDGTRFTVFGAREGFTDEDVSSISQDPTGRIWFGTRDGLFHFDGESFRAFHEGRDLPKGGFVPTLVDRHGILWFGGLAGLHRFDGLQLRRFTSEPVWALEESSDGSLWFGGETSLRRVRAESVVGGGEPEIDDVAPMGRLFFELFEDREGRLWIGTFGVARLEEDRIRHLGAAAAGF